MVTSLARSGGPYFEARLEAGEVVTRGANEMLLGHRIERDEPPADGGWVEWSWDGRQVTVTNDRFRSYPCYYALGDDSFRISSSIDRLLGLGVPRDLDLDALAAFLAVGYYVGDDTAFSAIRALPPGCRLTWRLGESSIESEVPGFRDVEMSHEQAMEGVTDLLAQAVSRRIPDDPEFRMPLSGGRDSRHVLLALERMGHAPTLCVTADMYPFDWGGDVSYARDLCARLGIEHRAVAHGPPIVAEHRKNRLTSYHSAMHAWFMPVAEALEGHTSHTYEGTPGSTPLARVTFSPRQRRLVAEGRWDELVTKLGKKDDGVARYVPLLSPALRELLPAERGAARVRAGLDRCLDRDQPYMNFRMFDRVARELALTPNALLGGIPAVFTPYYDVDLLSFTMSIPSRHIDVAFHGDAIAKVYPDVADIPYNPHAKGSSSRAFIRALDRDLLRYLLRHAHGSLVDRSALIRRAATGAVSGDDWFVFGRRFALTVYLTQLEEIIEGHVSFD